MRSGRSTTALCEGYTDVVDADLSKYFDTIPHHELLQSVARRVVDRHVLHLVKMWLKVPVEERDEQGRRRMTGGKRSTRGTPQGRRHQSAARQHLHASLPSGVAAARERAAVSGAGHQLRRRLRHPQPRTRGGGAGVDAVGDDPHRADAQRDQDVHPERTRSESFDFLGYTFGPDALSERWSLVSGREAVEEERAAAQSEPCARCSARGIRSRGRRSAPTSIARCAAGRPTSATARARRPTGPSTTTSTAACATFSDDGTRCPRAGTRRFSAEQVFGPLGVLRLRPLRSVALS